MALKVTVGVTWALNRIIVSLTKKPCYFFCGVIFLTLTESEAIADLISGGPLPSRKHLFCLLCLLGSAPAHVVSTIHAVCLKISLLLFFPQFNIPGTTFHC